MAKSPSKTTKNPAKKAVITQDSDEKRVKDVYPDACIVSDNNEFKVYSEDPENESAKLLAFSIEETTAWKKALHEVS